MTTGSAASGDHGSATCCAAAPRLLLLSVNLNCSGHNQSGNPGCNGIRTGNGVLCISCSRYEDLPGNCCKQARELIVIVLYALRPGCTVKSNRQSGQDRIKGVGNRCIIRSNHSLITISYVLLFNYDTFSSAPLMQIDKTQTPQNPLRILTLASCSDLVIRL